MKYLKVLFLSVCLYSFSFSFSAVAEGILQDQRQIFFSEIWAYLMSGEEQYLNVLYPISDLGYFGAGINSFGKLTGVPDLKNISSFKGRVHLVIAEVGNSALTHFCLDPQYPLRNALIDDIVSSAKPYDGVQIDFEAVSAKDADNYFEFLSSLKSKLGTKKLLSVALPARYKSVGDSYDYERIKNIADRIIIMAYDEHWSGSPPGSIASLDWCAKVSKYAVSKIGKNKVIMGLPFYGRAWADTNPAKAYKHSSIAKLVSDKKINRLDRQNDIPSFIYQETVNVQVYYEDVYSIFARMVLYKTDSVKGISFWRLGQEDPEVWKAMKVQK